MLFLCCIKLYKQNHRIKYKPADFGPQLSHFISQCQYKVCRVCKPYSLYSFYANKVNNVVCSGLSSRENQCPLNKNLPLLSATKMVS